MRLLSLCICYLRHPARMCMHACVCYIFAHVCITFLFKKWEGPPIYASLCPVHICFTSNWQWDRLYFITAMRLLSLLVCYVRLPTYILFCILVQNKLGGRSAHLCIPAYIFVLLQIESKMKTLLNTFLCFKVKDLKSEVESTCMPSPEHCASHCAVA